MRPTKKADRAMASLAKMLAKHGVATEVIEEVRDNAPTSHEAVSRQGEAVLLFLECPAKYTAKLCRRCGEPFGTNYRSVAYCSDSCRSREISEELGVKWDWLRATDEERWGGEPPLIIPPKAYQKIQQYIQFFADNLPTQNQTENQPESNQETQTDQILAIEELTQVPLATLFVEPSLPHTSPVQSLLELSLIEQSQEESVFDFG